jgi:RNA polymerase sigma-70 factor (ECF subfamily)
MDVSRGSDPADAEPRFRAVFAYLGDLTAYARRRGSPDPDAIAAETLTVAWRKLTDIPRDDPRPWLFATARNLLLAEWRQRSALSQTDSDSFQGIDSEFHPPPEARALDPELLVALRSLSTLDREALLLIAWDDLSPSLAAKSLGISQVAFRVRLHRARRRLQRALAASRTSPSIHRPEVERS